MHLRMAGRDGSRRPLVCFHLSPVSGVIYEAWLAEMGRDRRALAIDTPGYGMSDPPPRPPTIADYAGAMGDCLDALGITEFDVMGYHTGSKICVELARQRPAQVKHLVLVSAPVYTAEDLAQVRVDNSAPAAEPSGEFLKQIWQALWRWQDKAVTPEALMHAFPDHLRGGSRRGWGHQAAFAYAYPPHIVDVAAPILVLNPEDDLVTYTRRIVPYLRNGRLQELPGWSHGFLDLHPAEVAAMVRPFLDDLSNR
jgi:pimeloyl-ACP methyl ester carboxylesterase